MGTVLPADAGVIDHGNGFQRPSHNYGERTTDYLIAFPMRIRDLFVAGGKNPEHFFISILTEEFALTA